MISAGTRRAFSLTAVARVYVTRRLPAEILELLGPHDLRLWDEDSPVPRHVLAEEIRDVDGLLSMLTDGIDAALLAGAPGLRVISQMAVGVDNIDVDACRDRGIAVGHTPEVLTETVADHAFALLGAVVRRLPEGEREVKEGGWGPWRPFHLTGGDLHGTVLGVVGMGRIGRAVARRASGFDMDVIYTSPRPAPGAARRVELAELLERSDHVVLCCTLNEETRGLIGKTQLGMMKPTAYLVNVSRGPVVVTEALAEALAAGFIAGAGLDVIDPEPLPAGHRILGLPNCLVVPHIGSASVRTRTAMAQLAVENLIAGLEGRPLPSPYRPGL